MPMFSILLILTVAYQTGITIGAVSTWKATMKNNPAQLPKVFFAITTVRLIFSVAFFALALWLIHSDLEQVKIFTLFFLVVYILLLIFDTAYFYSSSQKINKRNE